MEFYIVDAFIDPTIPFSGNPATVIVQEADQLSDNIKQSIAGEFNLSETVFVHPISDDGRWSIRWFTPKNEVTLCGHATVAASFILFSTSKIIGSNVVKFESRFQREPLQAIRSEDDDGGIILDFPCNDCHPVNEPWLPEIIRAVVGNDNTDKVIGAELSDSTPKLLLRLADDLDDQFLLSISPDHQRLLQIESGERFRGIIVTQKSDFHRDGIHFRSRYFAIWNGIPEDPVTGSAHTVLTPFWSRIYQQMENHQKPETFYARQVSKRSGKLECRLDGNRVLIKGRARIFCHGTIDKNNF